MYFFSFSLPHVDTSTFSPVTHPSRTVPGASVPLPPSPGNTNPRGSSFSQSPPHLQRFFLKQASQQHSTALHPLVPPIQRSLCHKDPDQKPPAPVAVAATFGSTSPQRCRRLPSSPSIPSSITRRAELTQGQLGNNKEVIIIADSKDGHKGKRPDAPQEFCEQLLKAQYPLLLLSWAESTQTQLCRGKSSLCPALYSFLGWGGGTQLSPVPLIEGLEGGGQAPGHAGGLGSGS